MEYEWERNRQKKLNRIKSRNTKENKKEINI